jgi:hypothetical protein
LMRAVAAAVLACRRAASCSFLCCRYIVSMLSVWSQYNVSKRWG